jgi:hypothetical protein
LKLETNNKGQKKARKRKSSNNKLRVKFPHAPITIYKLKISFN